MPVPVAEETFGGRLRRLRTEAGLSIAEFAERTKYSKGYISKIETGAKPPNPELARCCDEALGASGALAELAPEETAGGPAEAVAAVAAGMGVEDTSTSPETAAEDSGQETPAPVGPVDLTEPARVTLAEAFAHEPADASPHIPSQNAGTVWPPEPPPVAAPAPSAETEPDGPFAKWAVRPEPEESSTDSLLSLSDPTREDATVPSAGHEETTTEPPTAPVAATPVSGESPTAESADLPAVGGKGLAVRDGSEPPQASPVVAVVPSQRRRLILTGLAVLLIAVAVAGAFLVLHLAGDERPPADGRVHPAVPAQQHEE